jgi:hypothetical protein
VSDVEFCGERFTVADRIGAMPLMRFAKVAQGGVDSGDMAGLAAMYDLLEQVIDPKDWNRFQATADRARVDGDELMMFVAKVMKQITDRPTEQPSDSSDGLPTTGVNSTAGSSSPVISRLKGRPDLQLMVLQAQEARAAS